MVFLDDLKDLVLYKKPFVLPINEKTIKKGSAIFLISPSFSASVKSIKSPYLVNKMDVFQSYYLEKNANYYINKEGFLQDIESTDEYLYEVGENDAMLTPAKKVEDYQGDLFFISDKYMDGAILNPRIPDNYFTQNGYEDITTPRVCFCSKVNNCLTALGQNVSGKEFYVYSPSTREGLEVWQPNEHSVPDFKVTNEYWILKPVQLKLVGRIRCTGSVGDGQRFTYGGDFAQTYDWNYKWLEKHGETISDVKPVEEAASTPKSRFFNDFKSFVASKGGLFKEIKPLKSPMIHEAKKKKETWLLLATYKGEFNEKNTSQFLHELQKNVKYDGVEVEFHTCYLPGDIFIFAKMPKDLKEESAIQEAGPGVIVSGKNIEYNVDAFKQGKCKLCFVTGFSGSGKTTLAKKIAEEIKCEVIELDDICNPVAFSDDNLKEYDELVYNFFKKNNIGKENRDKITDAWGDNKVVSEFVKYAMSNAKKQYVIEGVELYICINAGSLSLDALKSQSMIVVATSAIMSAARATNRDYNNIKDNDGFTSKFEFMKFMFHLAGQYAGNIMKGRKAVKKLSKRLQETTRSELSESEFGVPGKRKFPLDTPERVKSAIRFFNYVEPEDEAELAKRIKAKAKKFGIVIRCGKKNRLSKYITKEYVNEFMAAGAIGNDAYAVINGSIKQAAYQNGYKYIEDDEYPYTKKRKESRTIHKNTMMNNDFTNKE